MVCSTSGVEPKNTNIDSLKPSNFLQKVLYSFSISMSLSGKRIVLYDALFFGVVISKDAPSRPFLFIDLFMETSLFVKSMSFQFNASASPFLQPVKYKKEKNVFHKISSTTL